MPLINRGRSEPVFHSSALTSGAALERITKSDKDEPPTENMNGFASDNDGCRAMRTIALAKATVNESPGGEDASGPQGPGFVSAGVPSTSGNISPLPCSYKKNS